MDSFPAIMDNHTRCQEICMIKNLHIVGHLLPGRFHRYYPMQGRVHKFEMRVGTGAGVMKRGMGSLIIQEHQVGDIIVLFIPVYVVDNFA